MSIIVNWFPMYAQSQEASKPLYIGIVNVQDLNRVTSVTCTLSAIIYIIRSWVKVLKTKKEFFIFNVCLTSIIF